MRPQPSTDDSTAAFEDEMDTFLQQPLAGPTGNMTYSIAQEGEAESEQSSTSRERQQGENASKSGSAGSEQTTLRSAGPARLHSGSGSGTRQDASTQEQGAPLRMTSRSPVPRTSRRRASPAPASSSRPLTPILSILSGPTSILSGLSSRRSSLVGSLSDEDSQRMADSLVLDRTHGEDRETAMVVGVDGGSAPQLVMPSIRMPSRRPFTEEGRRMGRLKIMVAGAAGTGKTSLIKAIVQACDHIVHIDPITPSRRASATLEQPIARGRRISKDDNDDDAIQEMVHIHASTKPYPVWWSELDEIRRVKRRNSLDDNVLNRNICFVDTPGFRQDKEKTQQMLSDMTDYMRSQLENAHEGGLTDIELVMMLAGDGGLQVDVVLYLVETKLSATDCDNIRLLSKYTNIIPLLSKADKLGHEDLLEAKKTFVMDLNAAGIKPFEFLTTPDASSPGGTPSAPFAVSSILGSDYDNMDASVLMSADYVRPLVPTELSYLVSRIFAQETCAWLRHTTMQKLLLASAYHLDIPQTPSQPSSSSTSPEQRVSTALTVPGMGMRVGDDPSGQEQVTQIKLTDWAADLQRSITRNKSKHERQAQQEKAIWLADMLDECVEAGALVSLTGRGGDDRAGTDSTSSKGEFRAAVIRRLAKQQDHSGTLGQEQDPLGLLEVTARLRARSILVLEILGGLGVVGTLAVWAVKENRGIPGVSWLVEEWYRFWDCGR